MSNIRETLLKVLKDIESTYPVYHRNAYLFIFDSLDFNTHQQKGKNKRDFSVKEFLTGVEAYAEFLYGDLATDVFNEWNVKTARDVGNIVSKLVQYKVLHASENDNLYDFRNLKLQLPS